MRSIRSAALAFAAVLAFAQEARAQEASQAEPEYFGLVCESEPLARAIGDGFARSGATGFERRASIAVGNGCRFIGPYQLRPEITTTTIGRWEYQGVVLSLVQSVTTTDKGTSRAMYGYVVGTTG